MCVGGSALKQRLAACLGSPALEEVRRPRARGPRLRRRGREIGPCAGLFGSPGCGVAVVVASWLV